MRPVDLARAARVTPQTVRNLEAQNVLPAAERTASGYRRYGPTHLTRSMPIEHSPTHIVHPLRAASWSRSLRETLQPELQN